MNKRKGDHSHVGIGLRKKTKKKEKGISPLIVWTCSGYAWWFGFGGPSLRPGQLGVRGVLVFLMRSRQCIVHGCFG